MKTKPYFRGVPDGHTINGKHVNLGEFHIPGEPITFDYIITDLKTSALNVEAVDPLGNRFISTVNLQ